MAPLKISQIRYLQQVAQLATLQSSKPESTIATYKGRDPQTGDRLMQLPDGSTVRARYTGTVEPPTVARRLAQSKTLGVPGVFDA